VARALVRDAPLLLLDEPTAGLDPATEANLVRELLASTIGKTILIVTHQAWLTQFVDQVITLDGGSLRAASWPGPRWPVARIPASVRHCGQTTVAT
jgi:ABC-type transport system involved in cytochrome bd biosynthesis fused ATPase/permease subunit